MNKEEEKENNPAMEAQMGFFHKIRHAEVPFPPAVN